MLEDILLILIQEVTCLAITPFLRLIQFMINYGY